MILNLNAVENMYFRGNVKVTDIVVRISAKTCSRRANIYCTSNSVVQAQLALNIFEPVAFTLNFKMHISPLTAT